MATAKTTTTRTSSSAAASAKAETKAGSVDASAAIDLDRVRKPFYAYVGVADLAVEKLRALPEVYSDGFKSAQAQVSQARGSVKTLPVTVREQFDALPAKARGTYDDLVSRGQKLITTVRKNASAKAAVRQAKTAGSQVKGALTSARSSVKSAEQAVEDTVAEVG